MDVFIDFVKEWGYLAVFLGSLIEGESIILTASAMARLGHLKIVNVAIIAFIGTLIADQVLYFVGWYYGDTIFDRFPKLKSGSKRAFDYLHKYDAWFIIACRFVYGIRVTSAIVIGAAKIKPARFIPLNILSAAIWSVVSCTGGYLLGELMLEAFQHFETIQKYMVITIISIAVLIVGIIQLRKRLKRRK